MVSRIFLLVCVCCGAGLPLLFSGCGTGSPASAQRAFLSSFQNPVFEPILADPTVVRDPQDGTFYAYGTQDDWGDGQGSRLMPILKSHNLTDWAVVGQVFDKKPTWKAHGGLWAPDINLIDGRYVLYYSYSTWGDANPGIGWAVARHPAGPFADRGKLFDSEEIGVPNTIDPCFFEHEGQRWLFWGSYSSSDRQGIHAIELDGEMPHPDRKAKVAAGDWEATMIHRRGKYFYFFGSKGSCCDGANSTYHVMAARAEKPDGPYLDRNGHAITERGRGTLVLAGNEKVAGPGHNARIIRDDAGADWMLYHGILKDNGKVGSGASRRVLMLDRLHWVDGWPEIEGKHPNMERQAAPVFKAANSEIRNRS